LIVIYIR